MCSLIIRVLLLSLLSVVLTQNPLQPNVPTDPISSTYTLLEEIKAWRPLSVFYKLLIRTKFSKVIPRKARKEGILIFAPINSAFARSLYVYFKGARRELTDEEILEFMLTRWQTDLVDVFKKWPDIRAICEYHSVPRNYSERDWSSVPEIKTMLKGSRPLSPKFPLIFDHDHSYIAIRLARQVKTTTGRLNFVSNILWPIDARTTFIEGGGPFIGEKAERILVFEPLTRLTKFIDARNDLMFLQAMLIRSGFDSEWRRLIESEEEDKKLHAFLPTDAAFLAFIKHVFPRKYSNIAPKGEKILGNFHAIQEVLYKLVLEWSRHDHLPQLSTIMSYHLVRTEKSLEDLQVAGPQNTIALKPNGKLFKLSVTKTGVKDKDKSRPNAKFVTSYRTGSGNATLIDAVLLPYEL